MKPLTDQSSVQVEVKCSSYGERQGRESEAECSEDNRSI